MIMALKIILMVIALKAKISTEDNPVLWKSSLKPNLKSTKRRKNFSKKPRNSTWHIFLKLKKCKNFMIREDVKYLEELKQYYGAKKEIPKSYEFPALVALSYYPELIGTKIKFVGVKADIPAFSTVKPVTLFRIPLLRTYILNITEGIKPKEREPVLFKNLDFNMQIAMIGHELAHIADYLGKNAWQIIKTGILYSNKEFKKKLEHRMDISTIKHGLGFQLLRLSSFTESLQQKFPSDEYFKTYFEFYLSPEEIKKEIVPMSESI